MIEDIYIHRSTLALYSTLLIKNWDHFLSLLHCIFYHGDSDDFL